MYKIRIFSSQGITLASAKAVSAGKSCKQVDVSACANMGRKAVGELLKHSKGCSLLAENDDDRDRCVCVCVCVCVCWYGLLVCCVCSILS